MNAYRDPVPRAYADQYANECYSSPDNKPELQRVVDRIGQSIQGWRILDLGGGPGQFSCLLAMAGANVTWHDPSRRYLHLAKTWCNRHSVNVDFQVGQLEDLDRYVSASFDLIFNRICWYYAGSERILYRQVRRIVRPGGYVWVQTPNHKMIAHQENAGIRFAHYVLYLLHEFSGLKLAHVPTCGARLHRWFFGSKDFDCAYYQEEGSAIHLLARRRSTAVGRERSILHPKGA